VATFWFSFNGPQEVSFDLDLLEAGTIQHEDHFTFARMPIQISPLGPSRPHQFKTLKNASEFPLEGIKVVEFTAYAAGPMAGYLLAGLGAEVIKIEAPLGEEGRKFKPQFGGVSGYFINYNAGKKSIAIDLQSLENKNKLYDLIKTADIVLHNMRPGAMEKLGFGVDELLKVNPHLIYCSISGYGLSGPKLGALDTVIQGHLGLTGLFGDSSRPIRVGYSIADQLSGHFAAAGMVAALIQRSQINNGQIVDIAMSDSIAWLTQLMWNDSLMEISAFQIQASDGWIVATSSVHDYPRNLNCKDLIAFLNKQNIQAVPILDVDEVINQESLVRRGFMYQIKTQNDEMADLISPPMGIPVYEPKILHALGTHNYLLNTQK
jgi:crotonobetainyl-CoA:carnitine CoA-transferase CaiB-like acyl-CoA transferase